MTVEKFEDLSTTGQDAYSVLETQEVAEMGAELGGRHLTQLLILQTTRWVERQIREWHLHGLVGETKLERLKQSRRQ